VTNPATWSSYGVASSSAFGVGVGFVLGGGIACIDLDHVIVDGQLTEAAAKFVAQYPRHYIEISPSGSGLHIWGTAPEAAGTRQVLDTVSVERYSRDRYITVTGNVYQAGQLLPL
jgi:primase-polymerase (primpol)-like protein